MVSITVALIGVAGTIIGLIFTFRKEILQIKSGNEKIDSVKADTAHMKPVVDNTEKSVEYIRQKTSEVIAPAIGTLHSNAKGIAELVEELHHQEKCRQEVTAAMSRDYFVGGIENLYSENHALQSRVRELLQDVNQKRAQINNLKKENQKLEEELNELRAAHDRGFSR